MVSTTYSGRYRTGLELCIVIYLLTLTTLVYSAPSTNSSASVSDAVYSQIYAEPIQLNPSLDANSNLWGIKYSFFIKKPTNQVYDSLSQIKQHAQLSEQILTAEVISRTEASVTFSYTKLVEQKTVTRLQEWTFNHKDLTIVIHNIGKDDPTRFTRITVRRIRNKPYSQITVIHFTDEYWAPQYAQKAQARVTANKMVKKYRLLVDSIYTNINNNR